MDTVPASCQNCPHIQHGLLGNCQQHELTQLASAKFHQFYSRGQHIFVAGARPSGLFCIFEGKVKLVRTGADGKEQIVRLLKEGDVLGYSAQVMGSEHASTAIALTDCTVCLIARPDFLSTLQQNPQFSQAVMRLLADGLHAAELRMHHIAYKPVRERLAEALVQLYDLFEGTARSKPFSINIPREDLAALVGTAKETVSRLLSDFRAEGLVSTQGSRVTVEELEKLQHIASQFD